MKRKLIEIMYSPKYTNDEQRFQAIKEAMIQNLIDASLSMGEDTTERIGHLNLINKFKEGFYNEKI